MYSWCLLHSSNETCSLTFDLNFSNLLQKIWKTNKFEHDLEIILNAKQFNYNLSDVSSTESIKTKLIEERKKPNIKTQNNRYKML